MNKINKNVTLIVVGLILLSLIPVIIFIIRFHNHELSNESINWSEFASYFTEILTPIISIINILVLVYLTLKISKIEDERSQKSIDLQKILFEKEIKYQAYREVNNLFLRISNVSIDERKLIDDDKYPKLKFEFLSIVSPYVDLFNSLETNRLNKIGDLIFNMGVWLEQENSENKDDFSVDLIRRNNLLIKEYSNLLIDMRRELQTTHNK